MNRLQVSYSRTAQWGAWVWVVLMAAWQPYWPHDLWARSVLLLAVLVWVPLAFHLLHYPRQQALVVALAGAALLIAFILPVGWWAVLLTLPWCVVQWWAFRRGMEGARASAGPAQWAKTAAQVFLMVGGVWALADRAGVQLMGFDPAIVLLTAVHFHYAGFIFPLLAGWLYEITPNRWLKWAIVGLVASVPLTAVGITASQWYDYFVLEALSGSWVAVSGIVMALGYLRLGVRGNIYFMLTGGALLFSMALAWGYALRPFITIDVLNIPSMRAWHGTANALLVTGGGLFGHIRRYQALRSI